jgi:hypothetical protein
MATWHQPDFDVDDLEAAGKAAPGPPASRRIGRGQLDREGQSDDTRCQGAKAAYQASPMQHQAMGCANAWRVNAKAG